MQFPGGQQPDVVKTEYEFLDMYMQLNDSVRMRIGHQFDNMIKSCTFQGGDCLDEKFVNKIINLLLIPFDYLVILRKLQVQCMELAFLLILTTLDNLRVFTVHHYLVVFRDSQWLSIWNRMCTMERE